nr:hypothetical protein [Candidatus Sigynarchaeum springense]
MQRLESVIKPPSPAVTTIASKYPQNQDDEELWEKLRNIAAVTESLEVARLADALGVEEQFVWKNIFSWAKELGFIIKGNIVTFRKTAATEGKTRLNSVDFNNQGTTEPSRIQRSNCSHCGVAYSAEDDFCRNCGKKIDRN